MKKLKNVEKLQRNGTSILNSKKNECANPNGFRSLVGSGMLSGVLVVLLIALLMATVTGCDNRDTDGSSKLIPNEVSSESSGEIEKYSKKIWVVKAQNKDLENAELQEQYTCTSFFLSRIENNEIEGFFLPSAMIMPRHDGFAGVDCGILSGTAYDNSAECHFVWASKNIRGKVTMTFKEEDKIEATIIYEIDSKTENDIASYDPDAGTFVYSYHPEAQSGTFLFEPLNICDLKEKDLIYEDTFAEEDFSIWGKAHFAFRAITGGRRNLLEVYLTDDCKNVLYKFNSFPYDTYVKEFSFQDTNRNALKDLILIIGFRGDASLRVAYLYHQNSEGFFELDEELFGEINDVKAPHNDKTETVVKYLSNRDIK